MTTATVDVSVIVPARDASATIGGTLQAISDQDFVGSYEVIVVDNGSSDDTRDVVADAGVTLIERAGVWTGGARNFASQASSGEILAFTDADCEPTKAWLREGLIAIAGKDLIQGAVAPAPNVTLGPFDRSLTVRGEALYETANLFVRRELFDRLGGFDDSIRIDRERPFGEDVEFGWRARRLGARTGFSDRALVHHAVFKRSPRAFINERGRVGHFAMLVQRVPELRRAFFYKRAFLSRRSFQFDLAASALAAAAVALVAGVPVPIALLALLLAGPYTRTIARQSVPYRRLAPMVGLVNVAADFRAAWSLVSNSVRRRSAVL
jgi:glycosyltransferase involved in cell wall biosynthesis